MKVWVIQHSGHEDLGVFADVLSARNASVTFFSAQQDDIASLDPMEPDLLLLMGGAASAADLESYPFLQAEIALLKTRIDQNGPIIGFCLGGQLLALTLGAQVHPADKGNEVGWGGLTLTNAAKTTPLRHFAAEHTNMMHWHEDVFTLPEGATLLAYSDHYPQQIFSYGPHVIGFQCHPDISADKVKRWTDEAGFMAIDAGTTPEKIVADTKTYMPTLHKQAAAFFNEWLEELGL